MVDLSTDLTIPDNVVFGCYANAAMQPCEVLAVHYESKKLRDDREQIDLVWQMRRVDDAS